MKINAQQLAFLLSIPKKDAKIKILRSLRKDGQEYKESDHEFHPNPSAEIEIIEKHEKLKIKQAVENIKNNALTSPAYKKYLLYDYPTKRIGAIVDKEDKKENKEEKITRPKTVRLPPVLRSLLSEENLNQIEDYWNKNFNVEGIILKP
jgi:hypothetical protein